MDYHDSVDREDEESDSPAVGMRALRRMKELIIGGRVTVKADPRPADLKPDMHPLPERPPPLPLSPPVMVKEVVVGEVKAEEDEEEDLLNTPLEDGILATLEQAKVLVQSEFFLAEWLVADPAAVGSWVRNRLDIGVSGDASHITVYAGLELIHPGQPLDPKTNQAMASLLAYFHEHIISKSSTAVSIEVRTGMSLRSLREVMFEGGPEAKRILRNIIYGGNPPVRSPGDANQNGRLMFSPGALNLWACRPVGHTRYAPADSYGGDQQEWVERAQLGEEKAKQVVILFDRVEVGRVTVDRLASEKLAASATLQLTAELADPLLVASLARAGTTDSGEDVVSAFEEALTRPDGNVHTHLQSLCALLDAEGMRDNDADYAGTWKRRMAAASNPSHRVFTPEQGHALITARSNFLETALVSHIDASRYGTAYRLINIESVPAYMGIILMSETVNAKIDELRKHGLRDALDVAVALCATEDTAVYIKERGALVLPAAAFDQEACAMGTVEVSPKTRPVPPMTVWHQDLFGHIRFEAVAVATATTTEEGVGVGEGAPPPPPPPPPPPMPGEGKMRLSVAQQIQKNIAEKGGKSYVPVPEKGKSAQFVMDPKALLSAKLKPTGIDMMKERPRAPPPSNAPTSLIKHAMLKRAKAMQGDDENDTEWGTGLSRLAPSKELKVPEGWYWYVANGEGFATFAPSPRSIPFVPLFGLSHGLNSVGRSFH